MEGRSVTGDELNTKDELDARQSENPPKKPCRHCDKETAQRDEGIPYCSMDCINARRREKQMETFHCPYPGCEWETEYDPAIGLSEAIADADARDHRQDEHPEGKA